MILGDMEPVIAIFQWVKAIAKAVPTDLVAGICIFLGVILFLQGWQRTNYSIFDIKDTINPATKVINITILSINKKVCMIRPPKHNYSTLYNIKS